MTTSAQVASARDSTGMAASTVADLAHERERQHGVGVALRDEEDVHVVVAQVHEGDGAKDPHGRQRRCLVPHSRVQHVRPERRWQRLRAAAPCAILDVVDGGEPREQPRTKWVCVS